MHEQRPWLLRPNTVKKNYKTTQVLKLELHANKLTLWRNTTCSSLTPNYCHFSRIVCELRKENRVSSLNHQYRVRARKRETGDTPVKWIAQHQIYETQVAKQCDKSGLREATTNRVEWHKTACKATKKRNRHEERGPRDSASLAL